MSVDLRTDQKLPLQVAELSPHEPRDPGLYRAVHPECDRAICGNGRLESFRGAEEDLGVGSSRAVGHSVSAGSTSLWPLGNAERGFTVEMHVRFGNA